MKEAYLRILDDAEKRHKDSALTNPTRCDLFEYGMAVGVLKGIRMARDEFLGLLSADDEREKGR